MFDKCRAAPGTC